jgi:spore coat protein U-like protein
MRLNRLKIIAALALAGLAFSSHADTTTGTLNVSATVASTCATSGGTLGFGTYAGSQTDATGTLSVTCTLGTAAQITLNGGANQDGGTADAPVRRMQAGSTGNYLTYQLYSDSGRTSIWGNTTASDVDITGTGVSQSVNVYGRISGSQNVPAGSYTDTVTATITF